MCQMTVRSSRPLGVAGLLLRPADTWKVNFTLKTVHLTLFGIICFSTTSRVVEAAKNKYFVAFVILLLLHSVRFIFKAESLFLV